MTLCNMELADLQRRIYCGPYGSDGRSLFRILIEKHVWQRSLGRQRRCWRILGWLTDADGTGSGFCPVVDCWIDAIELWGFDTASRRTVVSHKRVGIGILRCIFCLKSLQFRAVSLRNLLCISNAGMGMPRPAKIGLTGYGVVLKHAFSSVQGLYSFMSRCHL
jgi:hypothetical protein